MAQAAFSTDPDVPRAIARYGQNSPDKQTTLRGIQLEVALIVKRNFAVLES
jgi:hypothetical protein